MVKRLQYSTYVLTVEGECEKWYFEHLRNLINANEDKKKTCVYKPDIKTNKNPKSYAKSFASLRVPFFIFKILKIIMTLYKEKSLRIY